MSGRDSSRLAPEEARRLYLEYSERLAAFVRGVVGDVDLSREVVHATFERAMESAGDVAPEARKAWLYRVAWNEALQLRRRQGIEGRAFQEWIRRDGTAEKGGEQAGPLLGELIRREQVEQVRDVLERLPPEQRAVVQQKIYDGFTFAEIAERSSVPLGTVLTRMRLALAKLRNALKSHEIE